MSFKDPYIEGRTGPNAHNMSRIRFELPREIHDWMRGLSLSNNVVQVICASLVHKLKKALDERDIYNFTDVARFESFLESSQLIDCLLPQSCPITGQDRAAEAQCSPNYDVQRGTPQSPDAPVSVPDDGRPATDLRPSPTSEAPQRPDPKSLVGSKGNGRRLPKVGAKAK